MTVWRSGVFTKYVVAFPAAGLKLSNDVFAGDMCLDADVSVRMSRGTAGCAFEIKLYDLPEPKVQALADALHGGGKPHVTVQLGYFDTKVQPILDGIYEKVETSVGDDKLLTTIKGREAAFYACATTPFTASVPGDLAFGDIVTQVMANARFAPGLVQALPQLNDLPSGTMSNAGFRSTKVLGILDEIATRASAELMFVDGKVFLGAPIKYGPPPGPLLDGGINLASFQPFAAEYPEDDDRNLPDPVPAIGMTGFRFTVTGDPTMRPGQPIVVQNVRRYDAAANPEFRIRQVEHRFTASGGYVCVGVATRRLADGAQARQIDSAAERNATGAARDVSDRIRRSGFDNPVVEIAAVKAAATPGLADLFYGQPAVANETQPSINVAVAQNEEQVYPAKPIASAFAWRKCGLVTPVYAGMKAVVAHNRALASDGLVTGFTWSQTPDFAAPPAEQGDWWLCLPAGIDATQPPLDSAKTANDLTAADGQRVIELKGLKITVGDAAMSTLGTRPSPGTAETCTIAHASGAIITVGDSGIEIDTGGGPKITLSSSGISMTDGSLNVSLSGGKLAIG